jgi:DNA polymerase-3 subunit delta
MSSPPVYLFLGPEQGEKREHIRQLLQSHSDLERFVYYGFETSIQEVIPTLRNPSLFQNTTAVEFRSAELIKKKADIEELAAYVKSPSATGILILSSDETRVDRKLDAAVPKANKKIFWEMFEDRKRGWLTNYFRKQGHRLTETGAEELLDMVANTTDEMRAEADKLCMFFPKGSEIDASDIEQYIYHSKEENVFTLFDRVSAGDLEGSLEILRKILLSSESNPVQILGGLLWQFRRLRTLKELLEAHYDRSEAFRAAGIRGKRSQTHYMQGVRTYTVEDLDRITVLFADYDAALRSSASGMQELMVELFLYYLIVRKGRTPEVDLQVRRD